GGAACGHELDVVAKVGPIKRAGPTRVVPHNPACTDLKRFRDDRLQGRAREANVGELARGGGVRTGKCNGGGSAHSLVVRRVCCEPLRGWIEVNAKRWIEACKPEAAIESRV